MKDVPERFCGFQRGYDFSYRKFVCGISDWQCPKPLCFYSSKEKIPKEGCDIANNEGKFTEELLGGLEKAGLLD